MAPFGAEKNVFRWSCQKGKSNMDSFWTISGFLGHQNDIWKFQKVSQILAQNSVKVTGNCSRFSWPTEATWYTKENYDTVQKVPQLATKIG